MIKIGIIGGTGYTGVELRRLAPRSLSLVTWRYTLKICA